MNRHFLRMTAPRTQGAGERYRIHSLRETEPGLDEQVFKEPKDPKWQEAWDITDHLMLAANDETKRLGASRSSTT